MKLRLLIFALAASFSAACGGGATYYLSVDSEIVPFEAPDEEDLLASDDDDWGDDGDSDAVPEAPEPEAEPAGAAVPVPEATPAPAPKPTPKGAK